MSNDKKIDDLIQKVLTSEVVAYELVDNIRDMDPYTVPVYNKKERFQAAKELVEIGGDKVIPALNEFFKEVTCFVNEQSDPEKRNESNLFYSDQMKYIGQALISLSGEEKFSQMIKQELIPKMEKRVCEEQYSLGRYSDRLIIFYKEFGNMGDWKETLYEHTNNENKKISLFCSIVLGKFRDNRVTDKLVAGLSEELWECSKVLADLGTVEAAEGILNFYIRNGWDLFPGDISRLVRALSKISGVNYGEEFKDIKAWQSWLKRYKLIVKIKRFFHLKDFK